MDLLTVVKVGGKIVENKDLLQPLLEQFNKISGYKILVHGGGVTATNLAKKLGIDVKMVEGRRITDEQMLEVVTMVYAGLVNKKIVAGLQSFGCNAIGLTGADLNLISAVKRRVDKIDYGFVGDIEDVNTREIRLLLNENVVPVIAPLTHDNNGTLLNTNADTIAAELAEELTKNYKVRLIYCFEKTGVLLNPDDDSTIIYELDAGLFNNYKTTGIIKEGMVPKLENGFKAKRNGVTEVVITSAQNMASGKGTRLL